jgi:hypothetical protein
MVCPICGSWIEDGGSIVRNAGMKCYVTVKMISDYF